ncbi:hypothetical protein DOM21_07250 [Bacteriovorax stolpii]|uniref:YiiX/YebB-like N1pC/P60 family cysteine hydrolase n=1 Tax=Bacteriovorax stolpii TaxID=960 RepID=UPI00115B7FD4|nr:YiiX/YebB-like N1pC/P60 family cysteine hydrolase [Bacteriovorax stolpii]QDK41254.1 hypothetical protein DOM21_07250 [Bacteriovorax stolpii]
MKTLFFTLFVAAQAFTTLFASEDLCQEKLREHMEIVTSSDDYFRSLRDHSNTISSYEITQLQKLLTKRYSSLLNFQSYYLGVMARCKPLALSKAVSIYDFSTIRELLINDTNLRRVVKGLTKFDGFQLEDFFNDYKKYNSNEFISGVLNEVATDAVDLPQNVKSIHIYQKQYDPNMYRISDKAIQGTTAVVAGVARLWGFISDHMKWRQGRLNNNEEAKSLLRSKLRPFDLVYEKRTFVLSNYTIPGHWGHVGVWLGTKEELIELGVWDQEYFAFLRKQVEAGNQIMEIRKPGLGFQSLDTFINLDEIAVTRVLGVADRAATVFQDLIAQAGKAYDFKFDARTADKITCAELITFSYGDIKWHETKTLFQLSLRPDDLALLSVTNPEQSEFVLYLKGNKRDGDFQNLDKDEWTKLFKLKKELTPGELEEEAHLAREKEEEEKLEELYRGA